MDRSPPLTTRRKANKFILTMLRNTLSQLPSFIHNARTDFRSAGGGMKKRGAMCCLWLGLGGSSLFGQQVLVSGVIVRPEAPVALSAPCTAPASIGEPLSPTFRVSTGSAEFVSLPRIPGLASGSSLGEATPPQLEEAVCTQALTPSVFDGPSDYAFGRLQFSTAAIKGAFRHENIVKMARNFVPGQPLPDAPSYVPLTSRQKFDLFLRRSHSADFAVGAVIDSLTAEASGAYPRFGGGMAGYGKRMGASVAGAESATLFSGYIFPTLLHQDPRYFRSRQNDISDRLAYAASRVIIGRSDDGRNVVNTSQILAQFVQAAVSNAYIPYRDESVSGTIENALAGLGSVAQADILNEFWPDIKEFFSRHNPESLLHRRDASSMTIVTAQR